MLPEKKCTGCEACKSVCNRNCITMKPDTDGFMYPTINADRCINCHLCEAVCPVINKIEKKEESYPLAFAGQNIDDSIRQVSSSGGIFSALAQQIIQGGGVVFGAAFTDDLSVKHIGIYNEAELKLLRGSKYVQSQIGDCYQLAETELKRGTTVLFTGTPCQIEGLLAYLRKPYENLIAVDLICHGVPSNKVWKEYLNWQRKENKKDIIAADFRNKSKGWIEFSQKIEFIDGTSYIKTAWDDFYMKAFLSNLSLRPSCYCCEFKTANRQSDLTLADLWGIDDIIPGINDNKGMSLIIIHSQKGKDLLEKGKEDMFLYQIGFEKAVEHNTTMIQSVQEHKFRQYFFAKLGKRNFQKLVQESLEPTYYSRVIRKLLNWKKTEKNEE